MMTRTTAINLLRDCLRNRITHEAILSFWAWLLESWLPRAS